MFLRPTLVAVLASSLMFAAATTHKKKASHHKAVANVRKPVPKYAAQTQPTPERYKQFQEALIKKGYLQGEATGKWDEASADAMRRFQRDQNLEPTGKPNQSLSILALGLGPKH
ncbi:MAG TPA: peptidoglycan-binding domain-containing protein [Bryobacteraceae bacterium]|nr:peptidoglycan-binding domain-containing protein [Bryobacteraceae bacterium]